MFLYPVGARVIILAPLEDLGATFYFTNFIGPEAGGWPAYHADFDGETPPKLVFTPKSASRVFVIEAVAPSVRCYLLRNTIDASFLCIRAEEPARVMAILSPSLRYYVEGCEVFNHNDLNGGVWLCEAPAGPSYVSVKLFGAESFSEVIPSMLEPVVKSTSSGKNGAKLFASSYQTQIRSITQEFQKNFPTVCPPEEDPEVAFHPSYLSLVGGLSLSGAEFSWFLFWSQHVYYLVPSNPLWLGKALPFHKFGEGSSPHQGLVVPPLAESASPELYCLQSLPYVKELQKKPSGGALNVVTPKKKLKPMPDPTPVPAEETPLVDEESYMKKSAPLPFEFVAVKKDLTNTVEVYARSGAIGSSSGYFLSTVGVDVKDGEAAPSLVSLSYVEAGRLLESLINAGVPIPPKYLSEGNQSFVAGELEATKKHLEDMRNLVSSFMGSKS